MRDRIGPYRMVRELGSGGMGVVYEAVHERLERRVAIKTLHAQLCENEQMSTRFLNEARAVNIVRHPGLVDVHELGKLEDGTLYIVMEFLEGETLSQRVRRMGRLTVDDTLRIAGRIAIALTAAHQKGVVHRDLKPDNVMIVGDSEVEGGSRVKLLDFGIAKLLGPSSNTPAGNLTNANLIIGTPMYMAPEQCRGGGDVDHKIDVYSLGIILHELLSGRPPFYSANTWELLAQHLNHAPPPLPVGTRTELAALIERMLAKPREARPSMGDVAVELAELRAVGGSAQLPLASRPTIKIEPARRAGPPTTLGGAVGERTLPPPPREKKPPLLTIGLAMVVVASVAGVELLRARTNTSDTPPAKKDVVSAASAPKPMVAAPAPAQVRWTLTSLPSGASIDRSDTGEHLGFTPWHREQPPGKGSIDVRLKLGGYRSRDLTLDQAADERRQVRLDPVHRKISTEGDDNDVQTVH